MEVEWIQVDWAGQRIWVPDMACPNGHRTLQDTWSPCGDCGFACLHWRCRGCDEVVRDAAHVCGHSGSTGR